LRGMNPNRASSTVVQNNAAVFGWGFMTVWMTILCIVTFAAFREAMFEGKVTFRYMPLILAVFWLAGIAGTAWAFRQKRVRMEIRDGRVAVTKRGLFRAHRWVGAARDVLDLSLVEDIDSDGDPYFRCVAVLPGPEQITIAEGHRRAVVEAAMERVRQSLGRS
jgi:hypothetical protein